MFNKGIFATLVAKKGKELEVEAFLRSAKTLVEDELGTKTWYAIKLGPLRYGIFDTFSNEDDRVVHLHGKVAEALMSQAPNLFEEAPVIENVDILAQKSEQY